jgi:hypothetical protein
MRRGRARVLGVAVVLVALLAVGLATCRKPTPKQKREALAEQLAVGDEPVSLV